MRFYIRDAEGATFEEVSFGRALAHLVSDKGYRLSISDETDEVIIGRTSEVSPHVSVGKAITADVNVRIANEQEGDAKASLAAFSGESELTETESPWLLTLDLLEELMQIEVYLESVRSALFESLRGADERDESRFTVGELQGLLIKVLGLRGSSNSLLNLLREASDKPEPTT